MYCLKTECIDCDHSRVTYSFTDSIPNDGTWPFSWRIVHKCKNILPTGVWLVIEVVVFGMVPLKNLKRQKKKWAISFQSKILSDCSIIWTMLVTHWKQQWSMLFLMIAGNTTADQWDGNGMINLCSVFFFHLPNLSFFPFVYYTLTCLNRFSVRSCFRFFYAYQLTYPYNTRTFIYLPEQYMDYWPLLSVATVRREAQVPHHNAGHQSSVPGQRVLCDSLWTRLWTGDAKICKCIQRWN